jgi:beta-glucanase (GH16 family)
MKFVNRLKIGFCFLLITSFGLVLNAQKPRKVIFYDDFSKPSIDRTKWNVVVTGDHFNDELQAYIDSASTLYIDKGNLVLRPQFSPGFMTKDGKQFDFTSARINTHNKFDFTYGKAEARIKLTKAEGLWPAWWLLGNDRWPGTGEIDIMENVGEADWANAAVHGPGYSGETPFVNRKYFQSSNDVTQWHIYAVEWTPTEMVFKYDNEIIFRVTKKMVNHFGQWVFDTPKHLILNFAVGGIFPVKINGIKGAGQRYGLPQSTADLIKQNKVTMLVDWVKISQ